LLDLQEVYVPQQRIFYRSHLSIKLLQALTTVSSNRRRLGDHGLGRASLLRHHTSNGGASRGMAVGNVNDDL
jgi:hypothetical protein